DVVICGGGVVGTSVAFWLARAATGASITVIEQDPTYKYCASTRSAASIRHQFSTEENIAISMFGTHFFRNADTYLHVDGKEPVDLQFKVFFFLSLPLFSPLGGRGEQMF